MTNVEIQRSLDKKKWIASEKQEFDIEAKVRQDCYNRGYEQGKKDIAEKCTELVENRFASFAPQWLIKEVKKEIAEGINDKQATCNEVSPKELRSICNYNEYGCESCGARVFCYEEKDN